MKAINPDQQGSTLIIVVWALAIIGVIATFMFYRSEIEMATANVFAQRLQLSQIAEAVLHERLVALAEDEEEEYDCKQDPWFANGRIDDTTREDGFQTTVLIEDEGSKPNLNIINVDGLTILTDGKVAALSILDWRDDNTVQRSEGAESDYYQGLTPAYKARDGCFSSVEELKMVKNAEKLYPLVAPEVTVHGKINPNTIPKDIAGEIFASLLSSYGGVLNDRVEMVSDNFGYLRNSNRLFNNIGDFQSALSMGLDKTEALQSLFEIKGHCNLNLASKTGLKVMLKAASFSDEFAGDIVKRQEDKQPFESPADVMEYFKKINPNNELHPEDYFTTVSTIIRYRIWVSKGSAVYYLDTVQERTLDKLNQRWQIRPRSWQVLINKEAPDLPEAEQPDLETKQ